MRFSMLYQIVVATAGICALPAHGQPRDTTPLPDSVEAMPAVTVSKAADAIGASIDIVAGTQARNAMKAAENDKGAVTLSGTVPWGSPVSASRVSSRFGMRGDPMGMGRRMHSGTDLVARMGSPIYATSDGVVSAARWNGGYGLFVALEHGGALQTRYGHLSRIAVMPGQRVRRGQVIGYVGSTGRSTGAHLHYEVRRNGVATDPAAAGLYATPRTSQARTRRR